MLSVAQQCALLELPRSSFYYHPVDVSEEDLRLMRLLDEQYTATPFYGVERMTAALGRQGLRIGHNRVRRLLRLMGLEAIYPKPKLSAARAGHRIYPYLLRDVVISQADQVWSADITYVPLPRGFMYLVAILDWHSRYVLAWHLSNTLDSDFCVEALRAALRRGRPAIFNSDQGTQFTSQAFTCVLEEHGIAISMDGRGRALDNVFIERLWWSVKYEDVYLRAYETVAELKTGLSCYFDFYCRRRPHQALDNRFPWDVYNADRRRQKQRKVRR